MIEMACERHAFISEILYVYNDLNPINDHKKDTSLQKYLFEYIKRMPKYKRIRF